MKFLAVQCVPIETPLKERERVEGLFKPVKEEEEEEEGPSRRSFSSIKDERFIN